MTVSRRTFVLAGTGLLFAASALPALAAGPPQKIMLMRHADKPSEAAGGVDATGQSSDKSLEVTGWERAGALVRFFATPTTPGIARPTAIFASGVTKMKKGRPKPKSARPFETVEATAAMLNLTIDASYTTGDEAKLVAAVMQTSGVVLVSWGHKHITPIAQAIPTVDPGAIPSSWPGSRFDMVYVFDLQPDGKYAFSQVAATRCRSFPRRPDDSASRKGSACVAAAARARICAARRARVRRRRPASASGSRQRTALARRG